MKKIVYNCDRCLTDLPPGTIFSEVTTRTLKVPLGRTDEEYDEKCGYMALVCTICLDKMMNCEGKNVAFLRTPNQKKDE